MNKLIITIFLISITFNGHSQKFETPENLVQSFFNKEIRNYKSVLNGEAKKQDYNPKTIPDNSTFEFLTIKDTETEYAIAVEINNDGNIQDTYVFLENLKGKWKITAFRGLWLPPFYHHMLNEYKDLNDSELENEYDKMFAKAKQSNDTISKNALEKVIGSKTDFLSDIHNMRLVVKSDKALINHFEQNQDMFNELKSKIIFANDAYRVSGKESEFKSDFQALLINSIKKIDDKMLFVIGGMIDNEVGYMFCPDENQLPKVSDRRFIMIRELGNGWYLYKTT